MDTDANTKTKDLHGLRTTMFVIIVMSPSVLVGMNLLYPVIAIPQMNLKLQESIFFELALTLGVAAGSLLNWIIVEKLGRRPALLFSVLPNLIGWPLLYYGYSIITTFVGALFNGLAIGAVGYCTLVYYTECIQTNRFKLRDSLLLWLGFSITCGMVLVLSFGLFLNYRTISLIATILALISSLLICFFLPESPTWLRKRGKDGDADFAEKQLRIHQPLITGEAEGPLIACKQTSVFVEEIAEIVQENSTKPFQLLIMLLLLLLFSFCTSAFSYLVKDIDENTEKIVVMIFNGTSPGGNSSSADNNIGSGISTVLIDTLTLAFLAIVMAVLGTILKIKKKE